MSSVRFTQIWLWKSLTSPISDLKMANKRPQMNCIWDSTNIFSVLPVILNVPLVVLLTKTLEARLMRVAVCTADSSAVIVRDVTRLLVLASYWLCVRSYHLSLTWTKYPCTHPLVGVLPLFFYFNKSTLYILYPIISNQVYYFSFFV